jgi:hypothetical protein
MKAALLILLVATFSVAQAPSDGSAEKLFVEGGKIRMDLSVGDYDVVPSHSNQIHVKWVMGTATGPAIAPVAIEANGSSARISTSGTSAHFHATIEVPKSAHLQIRQQGGDLRIAEIKGDKDLENSKGHIVVQVANPDQYQHVEASVTAGNLFATPFERVKSGLGRSFKWDGPGKFQLHVRLGEGDINLVPGDAI